MTDLFLDANKVVEIPIDIKKNPTPIHNLIDDEEQEKEVAQLESIKFLEQNKEFRSPQSTTDETTTQLRVSYILLFSVYFR